jgi:hypothetical protein
MGREGGRVVWLATTVSIGRDPSRYALVIFDHPETPA